MAETMTRLERLNARLNAYYEQETKILAAAQSYGTGSYQWSRADLKAVQSAIEHLEKEVAVEKAKAAGRGRNCVKRVVPLDY